MNRTTALLTAAVIAVLLAISLSPSPSAASDGGPDYTDTRRAVDCTVEGACVTTTVNATVKNCNEWYPSMSRSELSCDRVTTGLDNITYIADAANHVRSPFTAVNYSTEIRSPGLKKPWDIEFLPDGSALITEKDGDLKRYEDGRLQQVGSIEVVDDTLAGLMGLGIDPKFEDNGYIYVQYTDRYRNGSDSHIRNRVSRFTLEDGRITDENVLIDGIPGNLYHAGGRLDIGPDGKVYATSGDAGYFASSQSVAFLGGKVLRVNRDGTVPEDNPFNGSLVYSRGHRNPQGLAWNPETGTLFTTEHGPWRYDEINRIDDPGQNNGWGDYKCRTRMEEAASVTAPGLEDSEERATGNGTGSDLVFPEKCFSKWTLAPSGATFADEPGHPWHGDLFVAGLRGRHVQRFTVENGTLDRGEIFFYNSGAPRHNGMGRRLRDVEFHDGSLWALGDWSGIAVLTPSGASQ